jgi:hypothetical protein
MNGKLVRKGVRWMKGWGGVDHTRESCQILLTQKECPFTHAAVVRIQHKCGFRDRSVDDEVLRRVGCVRLKV